MGDGQPQLDTSNACFRAIYLRRNTKLAAAATLDLLCYMGCGTTLSCQFSSNSAHIQTLHTPFFPLFFSLSFVGMDKCETGSPWLIVGSKLIKGFHSFVDGDYNHTLHACTCAGASAVAKRSSPRPCDTYWHTIYPCLRPYPCAGPL